MARLILAFLLSACALCAQPRKELDDAGSCARCHVSSSLEWGISKHSKSSIGCTACHGESTRHVLNEQNGVKPDRIPRKSAIAGLCISCHQAGCPRTAAKADCQTCHHAHALVNPNAETTSTARTQALEAKTAAWQRHKQAGEAALRANQPAAARAAFRAALALNPADTESRDGIARATPPPAGFDLAFVPGAGAYIAPTQISPEQWRSITGAPIPAAGISWNDAQQFIAALNRKFSVTGFRLPTESEWETAARAAIFDPHTTRSDWCAGPAENGLRILRGHNSSLPADWFDLAARHLARPDQRLPVNSFRLAFE